VSAAVIDKHALDTHGQSIPASLKTRDKEERKLIFAVAGLFA
jgi:hypothetical protein